MRVSTPGMTVSQLQSALLTTIRSEFEHNLSQQIYMSTQAWECVRNARSNIIKLINSEAEKLNDLPLLNSANSFLAGLWRWNTNLPGSPLTL